MSPFATSDAARMHLHSNGADRRVWSLIETHQGIVKALAWRIHRKMPGQVDLDDLVSYGQIGLAQAAKDFDESRGTFATYAWYRVRGAILDGLRQMASFDRAAFYAGRYERAANDVLETASADRHSDAQCVGETARQLVVAHMISTVGGEAAYDSLADSHTAAPDGDLLKAETFGALRRLIATLPNDAMKLIQLTYFEGMPLAHAARQLGRTKSWASRLHARTLATLARQLTMAGVRD